MIAHCTHVGALHDNRTPAEVCEACQASGARWVSLRRCLTCGQVGCCDSSPNKHATAHFETTGHPIVRAAEVEQDWIWCYVDQISMRLGADGAPREVDLFYEAGLPYMRAHAADRGPDVALDEIAGKGFPLGSWVIEMRRRYAAGSLPADAEATLGQIKGWDWGS